MDFTVENICGLLIRSKLLSPDEVKTMYQRWQAEAKDAATNVSQFSRWLTAKQYVTEYQAALVARGHADDFFLDDYKILDRLGRGRMAGVYKAVHSLGQVVAIKVLPPSRARDPHMLARFSREVRLAMRLKHPNVVRAFQVGEANGLHYLVMEYLEGETLEDVLQRRKQLPPAEAVRLLHQALLGLEHIHERNMVHRDLKPANLMLVPAPAPGQPDNTLRATVKILDIGLGRALFDENSPNAPLDALDNMQLTGEGVLLGTPDYLSPEQARDARTIDIRSDIYSLGCVLYYALVGQPPFPDTNIISQMVRHATETPRPLKTLNPGVPDGLQQIVSRMLAKDPAQRYPTPERAAQALQEFLAAGSEPARAIEAEPQMKKYLTWLETSNANGENPGPATAQLPLALPVPTPVPAKGPASKPPVLPNDSNKPMPPEAIPIAPARRQHGKKHKGKGHAGPPPSVKRVKAVPAEDFDVELVPAVMPVEDNPEPGRAWGLSRRDWILLGIGAGAALVAVGVGVLLHVINDNSSEGDD
jgi:serine/threonine protein kinase